MTFQALLDRVYEIQDLRKAIRVLTWDREVNMPRGGESQRTEQIATLKRLSHSLYTSSETGDLIEKATSELNGAPYLSSEASLIRFLRRDYSLARKLSADFVARSATISSQATAVWKQAKIESNFAIFKPWLEKVVSIAKEQAEIIGYDHQPYDALLDQYEPGSKTATVAEIFEAAKSSLIPLYQAVGRKRTFVRDDFLHQSFDIQKQESFARYLAQAVGYDFNRGHLATAVHPFSTSLSLNDVRITTRYNPNFLSTAVFATLHEAGHALYIQNIDPALNRTPLAKETSAGLDESQSRMIENIIGRSFGFWNHHFPVLQSHFPDQLGNISAQQFYKAINKVQPTNIRVEADELTYNMHIILRFELEQDLINGKLSVANVPEAWNQKMVEFLGIIPPNDADGCLQDIHWTLVGFGYFPTYALGNLYAAQFFEAAVESDPSILAELENGRISSLLTWLRKHIHRYGRKLTASEIIEEASGRPLDHQAFVRYASNKFSKVYDIAL